MKVSGGVSIFVNCFYLMMSVYRFIVVVVVVVFSGKSHCISNGVCI